MIVAEALRLAEQKLSGFGNPKYEARELIQALLKLSAADLITREDLDLNPATAARLEDWLDRRAAGMPLAYLSGVKGFYKNTFVVVPGVLVPRPESELVVEVALKRKPHAVRRIGDFGAGSGCIGLSVLNELPEAKLYAIDAAPAAIEIVARNAELLGLDERVIVAPKKVEDWFPAAQLDIVVANPPYIASGDPSVQESVHKYEPHEALYAEEGGFAAIRSWAGKAFSCLRSGGIFVCEIGAGQKDRAVAIIKQSGFSEVECATDLAGIERVISGVKHG